ncbi:Abi family protein [Myxosarcina sp. GI1]|uniref:Abi family protein n=1 Tax=Myxosarcina sp. GI1 TaxID=1541065 RepID=UPI00055A9598|nr:Abi family protein [Myxosarcina sp. GI1]
MKFNKPHLTIEQQLALLEKRGLIVSDRERAKYYLGHLNYYRLSGYWYPFKQSPTINEFRPNTFFEDVLNLYIFDRQLRLLILDAIEQIEVSVRAKWAYYLCEKHGAHAHLNSNLFSNYKKHQNAIASLKKSVSKSHESFILHLTNTYEETLPPLWALVEIMTFGQLSYWFEMLKFRSDRNVVAREYDMDEKNFGSILHHLTVVRNKCAHHNRLWNCEFTIIPKLPNKRPAIVVKSLNPNQRRKIYNTLVILIYLLYLINPSNNWKNEFLALTNKHRIDLSQMGFPSDFESLTIWH